MKIAYSCVVDASPKFEWQAVNLSFSLLNNVGASPADIKVHVTPDVSAAFRDFVLDHGMDLHEIQPFPGNHGYCNKLQQAASPAFRGYDKVVLCDCDLFFLADPDFGAISSPAAGRIVDRPLPPPPLLLSLYAECGIAPSPVLPVGFAPDPGETTVASNWNGGLYVLDAGRLAEWGATWRSHAERLLGDLEALGPYGNHVDQISWALTLDGLEIPYEHLAPNHNFPLHHDLAAYREIPAAISSVHYHDRMDDLGRIARTGVGELDLHIDRVNESIRELILSRITRSDGLFALFQRWQGFRIADVGEGASRGAFHNARYLRHNARRLEHLASLDLDLEGKTVLEVGAGVGDHSEFFLDRDCRVTSVEPRAENVAHMLSVRSGNDELPIDRRRIIKCAVEEVSQVVGSSRYQIVYNYGLLYHLGEPEAVLRDTARSCAGLYLLETAVSDLAPEPEFDEDRNDPTNSIDGPCRLLSRAEIFRILGECLPYVYMPVTQPAHEQFLRDWTRKPDVPVYRHRAVFVGSIAPLDNPKLAPEVMEKHVGF
jgi:2-polyprenyl-3-methyl-5-hydroxy-6-metoxy-1,4-benzoquinol methylase